MAKNPNGVLAPVERPGLVEANERVQFRLFIMPCCGFNLCWVNPRLPSFCPECGKRAYMKLRTGEHTYVTDDNAWLKTHTPSR
jgi:hypothetical protein